MSRNVKSLHIVFFWAYLPFLCGYSMSFNLNISSQKCFISDVCFWLSICQTPSLKRLKHVLGGADGDRLSSSLTLQLSDWGHRNIKKHLFFCKEKTLCGHRPQTTQTELTYLNHYCPKTMLLMCCFQFYSCHVSVRLFRSAPQQKLFSLFFYFKCCQVGFTCSNKSICWSTPASKKLLLNKES